MSPESGPGKSDDADDIPEQEGEENQEAEAEEQGSKKGRTGRRKVQPLLGMLQWVVARRSDAQPHAADAVDFVQLFVPSQVMPKAGLSFN